METKLEPHQITATAEEILRRLCDNLVVYQDDVELIDISNSSATRFVIRVNESDMPMILGGEGRRLRALRCIMQLIGNNLGRDIFILRVDNPTVGNDTELYRYVQRNDWPKEDVMSIMESIILLCFQHGAMLTCSEPALGYAVLHIEVSPKELYITDIERYLQTIFSGIGLMVGCSLNVEITIKPKARQ